MHISYTTFSKAYLCIFKPPPSKGVPVPPPYLVLLRMLLLPLLSPLFSDDFFFSFFLELFSPFFFFFFTGEAVALLSSSFSFSFSVVLDLPPASLSSAVFPFSFTPSSFPLW